jgi:cell division protein ZipA
MLIVSLLFAVVMIVGIYLYLQKNRSQPSNRYRRRRSPPVIPTFDDKDIVSSLDSEKESDEALGLRVLERKPNAAPVQNHPLKSSNLESDCVIALYLMAPEGTAYAGYELLQSLLSSGMRYGIKRIFNRHEHKDGRGEVLFHCASAFSPGTFDLTKMGSVSCKGLCLFFTASSVSDPLSTFDCMLETIDQLVDDLGGEVLDEHRAVFTKERMVQYRKRIRDFEDSSATADLFVDH